MKKILFIVLAFTFACSPQEDLIRTIDPVKKSKVEINDFMISLQGNTNENARESDSVTLNVSEQIIEILLSNGFVLEKNPELYYEILINPINNAIYRVGNCTYAILHLEGDGITGTGTSVIVWECSGSFGNYISNEWWVNGEFIGENEWYY